VCTDDGDDDRDKDKDEANESINPSAVVILESAHLLGRLKRPHRCNIFFSFADHHRKLVQYTKNSYTQK
jgi:hypothetical protein